MVYRSGLQMVEILRRFEDFHCREYILASKLFSSHHLYSRFWLIPSATIELWNRASRLLVYFSFCLPLTLSFPVLSYFIFTLITGSLSHKKLRQRLGLRLIYSFAVANGLRNLRGLLESWGCRVRRRVSEHLLLSRCWLGIQQNFKTLLEWRGWVVLGRTGDRGHFIFVAIQDLLHSLSQLLLRCDCDWLWSTSEKPVLDYECGL